MERVSHISQSRRVQDSQEFAESIFGRGVEDGTADAVSLIGL